MNFIYKILVCCVLALPLISHAQSSSERTDEIMRTVISVDGYIDRNMHREFWAALERVRHIEELAHGLTSKWQRRQNEAQPRFGVAAHNRERVF